MPFVIHDSTPPDVLFPADKGRGCVPRDYSEQPEPMLADPGEVKLVPRSEWSARCKELKERKARLRDLRRVMGPGGGRMPALDQGKVGYCWAHSSVQALMFARAVMGMPYVPLSAYAVAATIKKGADEGGWAALSAQFLRDRGTPSQAKWPQGDRDYRAHDRPDVWEDAKQYQTVEDWADVRKRAWDQTMSTDVLATLLLSGVPVAADYAWWGHSVCLEDWLEIEPGSFGPGGVNSWGEGWGHDGGEFELQGDRAKHMGAVAILTPSFPRAA